MTTNHAEVPIDPMRKTALVAGVLYLVTFVGSIPALPLYHNLLHDPRYLLGGASDTGVLWGAIGEVICALAGIGTNNGAITVGGVMSSRWPSSRSWWGSRMGPGARVRSSRGSRSG